MGKLYGRSRGDTPYHGNKKIYQKRKETIEKVFVDAKENME